LAHFETQTKAEAATRPSLLRPCQVEFKLAQPWPDIWEEIGAFDSFAYVRDSLLLGAITVLNRYAYRNDRIIKFFGPGKGLDELNLEQFLQEKEKDRLGKFRWDCRGYRKKIWRCERDELVEDVQALTLNDAWTQQLTTEGKT
jgi:hypothetical protein